MAWLHPSERSAWLDLLPLVIIGGSLFDQLGIVGAFIGFVLLHLRLVLAPIYVVAVAHVALVAMTSSWPAATTLVGLEIGSVLLLARPSLGDPEPFRSVFTLFSGYLTVIGFTIVLLGVIDVTLLQSLTLIGSISLASYVIHRLQVSRMPYEVESV